MNANQFLKAVSQLQGWREYAFLLALAERSFPNYALFADAVGIKTGGKVRQLLDHCWENLHESTKDDKAPQLLAKLEQFSPDIDAYDVYGVRPAFDFCQILEQAMLARLNPAKERALEASQLATSTVVSFVEVSEGEDLPEHELVELLDQHPLLKEDKRFQREVLQMLKKQRAPKQEFVDELRELAGNDGVSNLGISLDDE